MTHIDKKTLKRILFVTALISLIITVYVATSSISDVISNSDTQVYYEQQVIHNPYQYIENPESNINKLPDGYQPVNKMFQTRRHARTVL